MEILVDVFGSDDNIDVAVEATCNMINKVNAKLTLVGKSEDITEVINSKYKNNANEILEKINILNSDDYITNEDEPAWAIKNKKKSSIVVAYDYMKTATDVVFISAGSTGAVMAGALLKLGRIKGIHRPALLTILPTASDKKVILLDSGANLQAKDISMLQYAKLGSIYAEYILGVKNPKIALLNIGEEKTKGTPELKQLYKTFDENVKGFIGNIEARYILDGKADVVVCDGLLGNIALKSIEGTAKLVKNAISDAFKVNIFSMLKGVLVKSTLTKTLKKYDYKRNGGAVLLGVNKPVIKVHGSSDTVTFEQVIMQAQYMLDNKIVNKIEEEINKN